MSLADSAGGKVMRVVVDSMRGDSASPIPSAVLDSAEGRNFAASSKNQASRQGWSRLARRDPAAPDPRVC